MCVCGCPCMGVSYRISSDACTLEDFWPTKQQKLPVVTVGHCGSNPTAGKRVRMSKSSNVVVMILST